MSVDTEPVQLQYVAWVEETTPPQTTRAMRIVARGILFEMLAAIAGLVATWIVGVTLGDTFSSIGASVLLVAVPASLVAWIAILSFAAQRWDKTDRKWRDIFQPALLAIAATLVLPALAGFALGVGSELSK